MNNYGQLGVSANKYDSASLPVLVKALSNVFAVKVAAGADYSVVLTDDGYVYSFGNNTRGQLGTADVNGSQHPTPVLMRGVGGNGTLGGVVDIAAGAAHTMLLLGNKTMWIVGDNTEKQLGVIQQKTVIHILQLL